MHLDDAGAFAQRGPDLLRHPEQFAAGRQQCGVFQRQRQISDALGTHTGRAALQFVGQRFEMGALPGGDGLA